ncbi:MAG: protein kinase [bacterium]|nr:protein kinase [bacterium]
MDVEAIFHAALEKGTAAERAAYLDGACGADPTLRDRVDALLAAHDRDHGFLEHPTAESDATIGLGSLTEGPGTVIGRYKLLQQIGQGGFGVVYLAEQSEPVKRRVALKIIKLGMDTKQVIARFEAERQALAMMDHANIARVFDAGATDTGRPFFVMELVKGVPITEYCNTERLDTAQRLELFRTVCQAIQHAHTKGIIHRDIKPSNVMVTLHDGVPVPKVIDFGIAKATNAELTEKTLFTEYRQLIGTPAYMSPEQAEMSGLDIDTRTDVYSLGVLLYELLTGTTPFDGKALLSAGYEGMLRIIREQEPVKPSTRLEGTSKGSQGGPPETGDADRRRSDPASLVRSIRGDLDWIVMKCLTKDRRQRYESPRDLSADVGRHLSDEPVSAGPPGMLYRLGKFGRRNRAGLAVAGVLTLIGAILIAGGLWVRAGRLESERAQTLLVNDALEHAALALGRAIQSSVGDQTEWLVARAAGRHLEQTLMPEHIEPPTRERATAFLQDLDQADADRQMIEHIEQVVIAGATHTDKDSWLGMERELREAFAGYGIPLEHDARKQVADKIRSSRIPDNLGDGLELWLGTVGQLTMFGEQLMTKDQFFAWVETLYEADPDPFRTAVRKLVYAGRRLTAEEIDAVAQSPGREGATPRSLSWLAMVYFQHGFADRGDALYADALRIAPADFMLNFDIAYSLVHQERWQEAIRYQMRCLTIRPDSAGVWRGMGTALRETGELAESRSALERAVELQPDHAPILVDLAETLLAVPDYTAAVETAERALGMQPDLALAHGCLGRALQRLDRLVEALAALERCHDLGSKTPSWSHPSAEWVAECKRLIEKKDSSP